MLRLRSFTGRLANRILPRGPSAVAKEVEILDRGRRWKARPIIHLPGELDRILGHHPDSKPSLNMALIDCKERSQGPTVRYRLENVLLAEGAVLLPLWACPIIDMKRRLIIAGDIPEISEGALCSTPVSEKYFGHWLRDQLPHEILAADLGLLPLALKGVDRPSEPGYRDLTGLQARPVATAFVRNLHMFDDFEINDHRVDRINRLRTLIRQSVENNGPEIVYIARGGNGVGREMLNELELIEHLEKRGITCIFPEVASPAETARCLKSARIVVGPEGSAMSHAFCAMPEGATMLQIQPPRQFNLHYRIYLEALNMRHGIVFGEDQGYDGYTMAVDRVLATIDLIDRQVG